MKSIEKIEDGIAVLIDENGQQQEVDRLRLPEHAVEGDLLKETAEGFEIDYENTAKRRDKNFRRLLRISQRRVDPPN